MERMLENDFLRLRAPEPEDLEYLYGWENDDSLWQFGNTTVPFSRFALKQHIEQAGHSIFDTRQLRLIIADVASGKPVGTVDLYDFDPYHQRAGVGIMVDSGYQQKGYATQALRLLKAYAFDFLGVHQLYAHIPRRNVPSLNLFRLCGFTESGVLRQWHRASHGYEDVCVLQCITG
jgi:diamine N-acetyltransferase